MLSEITIIPDVFDENCYTEKGACKPILHQLKDIFINEALLTSLSEEEFYKCLNDNLERFHNVFKSMLPNLKTQNRFINRPQQIPQLDTSDSGWIKEAIEIVNKFPNIENIFTGHTNHSYYKRKNSKIHNVENIHLSAFWNKRSLSKRLLMSTVEYINTLELVLINSNSIMFIDPYLDPSPAKPYKEFINLLVYTQENSLKQNVKIEIHIKLNHDRGDRKDFAFWEKIFKNCIFVKINKKLKIDVYIWDEFHDRYLISDLVGISLSNGFNTTSDITKLTTWTMLSRKVKDNVQTEFSVGTLLHNLIAIIKNY